MGTNLNGHISNLLESLPSRLMTVIKAGGGTNVKCDIQQAHMNMMFRYPQTFCHILEVSMQEPELEQTDWPKVFQQFESCI